MTWDGHGNISTLVDFALFILALLGLAVVLRRNA